MKFGWVQITFSNCLLFIYTLVIFQHGVIDGIHFLSHATDMLSSKYAFHSHGNGNFHVHHHDLIDTFKTILYHNDQPDHQNEDQLPNQQQEIKLHLPEYFYTEIAIQTDTSAQHRWLLVRPVTISLDVLTPPPKV